MPFFAPDAYIYIYIISLQSVYLMHRMKRRKEAGNLKAARDEMVTTIRVASLQG